MCERAAVCCAIILLAGLTACGEDRVLFENSNSTGQIGILLDGAVEGTATNDRSYTTEPGGLVLPGEVTAGGHNEVIAFQERRAVQLVEDVPWSDGIDTVLVPLEDDLILDFQAWLLQGPFEERQEQAIQACVRMAQIWADERVGISIGSFRMNDSTEDPERDAFLDFDCDEAQALRDGIGHEPGRLNVYYVDRVDFGGGLATTNGVFCPQEKVLVIGSAGTDHLSVHEVGHALALEHIDLLAEQFDPTNVMHSFSAQRLFLTEGQTFRVHLTTTSALNGDLALRPAHPTRDCFAVAERADDACPAIQKRIWRDGAFGPN
jgi:hypothetical protein